tara:strand:+ start:230 stop:664 length:435 start_codon:yes stop_codon:yes gene_type:complete
MALSNNVIILSKNPITAAAIMLNIFVISNIMIMKAIQYAKQIIKKSIILFYSTCTNDLIIYSKQASNIELFILAFFIECNRLFIADSIVMNTVQKQVFEKLETSYRLNCSLIQVNWIEAKQTITELLTTNGQFSNQFHEDTIIN